MGIVNRGYSNVVLNINGKNYKSYNYSGDKFSVRPSSSVSSGCAYVVEDINYICKDYNFHLLLPILQNLFQYLNQYYIFSY